MKLNTSLPVASIFILLAACSSLEISQDYDESYNFSNLKTFNWETTPATGAPKGTQSPMLLNPLTEQRIRRAVEGQLVAKGFQKQETNPDFLIDYYLGVQSKRVGTRRSSWRYDEGSLVLDFVDSRTNELIWRGRVADWVEDRDVADEASINNAIKQMLAKFPPS
jgi:hypothetical protein